MTDTEVTSTEPENPETSEDEGVEDGEDPTKALRDESARRRIEAREANERADRLAARLTTQVIATATADILESPEDFARFHDGPVPTDDDGYPDPKAITESAREIAAAHPRIARRRFSPIPAGPQGATKSAPTSIMEAVRAEIQ